MVKKYYNYLLLEAILCLSLAVACYLLGAMDHSLEIIFMPIDLIARVLRFMSLSSYMGNVVACIIYAFICFMPSIYCLWLIKKNSASKKELLLLVLSIYMLYMLYMFINPQNMSNMPLLQNLDKSFLQVEKFALASVFYSILLGYISFIILQKSNTSIYILQKILFVSASIYVIYLFYFSAFDILNKFGSYSIANIDYSADYLILVLKCLTEFIPILFSISILVNAIPFLITLQTEPYGAGLLEYSKKLSDLCKKTVIVSVASNITINLSQLLLSSSLYNANYNLNIPIIPLILALSFFIITKYIDTAIKIKEENDRFI